MFPPVAIVKMNKSRKAEHNYNVDWQQRGTHVGLTTTNNTAHK